MNIPGNWRQRSTVLVFLGFEEKGHSVGREEAQSCVVLESECDRTRLLWVVVVRGGSSVIAVDEQHCLSCLESHPLAPHQSLGQLLLIVHRTECSQILFARQCKEIDCRERGSKQEFLGESSWSSGQECDKESLLEAAGEAQ